MKTTTIMKEPCILSETQIFQDIKGTDANGAPHEEERPGWREGGAHGGQESDTPRTHTVATFLFFSSSS